MLFIVDVMALHRMSFARTCLTIGHDSTIKSIQDVIEDRHANIVIDLLLRCFAIEEIIKHERYLLVSIRIFNDELLVGSNSMYFLRGVLEFLLIKRTKAAEHFDIC